MSDILIAFGKGQWLVKREKNLCNVEKLETILSIIIVIHFTSSSLHFTEGGKTLFTSIISNPMNTIMNGLHEISNQPIAQTFSDVVRPC